MEIEFAVPKDAGVPQFMPGADTSSTALVPMSGIPSARVRNAQDLMAFMDEYRPGLRHAVREAMPESTLHALDTSPRTAWYSIEEDANNVDTIVDVLGGGDDAADLWAAYASRFIKTPLQRALIEGAFRIFGVSVGSLTRMTPRVWSLCYRGCGTLSATKPDKDERTSSLIVDGLHPVMCMRRGYYIVLRGLFEGMYRIAGEKPDFDIEFRPEKAQIEAHFRW